jgi:hypothetical protein
MLRAAYHNLVVAGAIGGGHTSINGATVPVGDSTNST